MGFLGPDCLDQKTVQIEGLDRGATTGSGPDQLGTLPAKMIGPSLKARVKQADRFLRAGFRHPLAGTFFQRTGDAGQSQIAFHRSTTGSPTGIFWTSTTSKWTSCRTNCIS